MGSPLPPTSNDQFHTETQFDLAELQTHVRIQDEQITAIKGDVNEIKNSVGLLLQRSSEAGKLSFQSLGPLGAVGGIVIAFLSMFISNQVSPIANQMMTNKETAASIKENIANMMEELEEAKGNIQVSIEKDARSEADRTGMHDRLDRLGTVATTNSTTLQGMRAWMERSVTEIETQVSAVEQTRNMQVSVLAALLRPMWEKAGMGPFPYPFDVQPSIANRSNGSMP